MKGQKIGANWIKNVHKDLYDVGLTDGIILDRTKFRMSVEMWRFTR